MVVVQRLAINGVSRMFHPHLTDGGQFEQTFVDDILLRAVVAEVTEVHLPRGILYLTLLVGSETYAIFLVVIIVTTHVVMTVVTVDRHQRVQEYLTIGDTCGCHAGPNVGLEVLHHIHCTYEIVGAVLL